MIWLRRVNMTNFGAVTPEFKRVKGIHLSLISSLATFALRRRPLLDLTGISTEFSGAMTTQFCFTYTLEIERHCYAVRATRRLYYAFIVLYSCPKFCDSLIAPNLAL